MPYIYVPARKANKASEHKNNQQWPESTRRKVVKTWLQTGSLPLTAEICKVPYDTVDNWRYRTTWWKEYVQRYRDEADASMAGRIEKLLGNTIEQLEDRINNGDEVFNSATGETTRVKVKVRDLNTTAKVLADRHDTLIQRAKNEHQATEQINDKLTKLANAFEKFAKKEIKEADVLDVEFVEVIHDNQPNGDNVVKAP